MTSQVGQAQVEYILQQAGGVDSGYICDYCYPRQCPASSYAKVSHLQDSHRIWGVPLS